MIRRLKLKNLAGARFLREVVLGGDYRSVFGHFHGTVEADAFAVGEFDFARSGGEQCIVMAFFDIFTRVNTSAALANDDHASFNGLAIMDFYP